MDRAFSISEASERLPELLRDVAAGESFTIIDDGRAVARVTRAAPESPVGLEEQSRRIKAWLERTENEPNRMSGPWTRDDLYE